MKITLFIIFWANKEPENEMMIAKEYIMSNHWRIMQTTYIVEKENADLLEATKKSFEIYQPLLVIFIWLLLLNSSSFSFWPTLFLLSIKAAEKADYR